VQIHDRKKPYVEKLSLTLRLALAGDKSPGALSQMKNNTAAARLQINLRFDSGKSVDNLL
jgi:hypothetical protein